MVKKNYILRTSMCALTLISFVSSTHTFKKMLDWHTHNHKHEISALYNNTKDTIYVTNTYTKNNKKITQKKEIAPSNTFELNNFFGEKEGKYTLSLYRNKSYCETKMCHKKAHLIKTIHFNPSSPYRYTVQLEEGGMVNQHKLEAIVESKHMSPKKEAKSVKEMTQ